MYELTVDGLFLFDMTDEERAACWWIMRFYPVTYHEWYQNFFSA